MSTDKNDTSLSVAVVGLALRFPGASSVEQYWQNLKNGVCSIENAEQAEEHKTEAKRRTHHHVDATSLPQDIEYFDADFFGFNHREAELLDPQHRFLLECAYEALETSGLNTEKYKERVGVYVGCGANNYLIKNIASHPDIIRNMGFLPILLANEKDFAASLISYKLNLRGPSLSVNTACSTGLVAIDTAYRSLINYDCDIALAGAASINASLIDGYNFAEGGIFSPDGLCRVFSTDSCGTVPASGAGVLVLKRLDDAIADDDEIHAVIRGSAVNSDGGDKIGMTAPAIEGQARVIAEALAFADVNAEEISYVETHGTGTKLGDAVEIQSLEEAYKTVAKDNYRCAIGSVKSNLGHLDAAAGIASIVKVIAAIKHKQLPPTIHFEEEKALSELKESCFFVNDQLVDWRPVNGKRLAGVSSFGLGGTNSHLILEEAPQRSREQKEEKDNKTDQQYLFFLSARSRLAFESSKRLTIDMLNETDASIQEVSATSINYRQHHECRAYFFADSIQTLISELKENDTFEDHVAQKLVMMFPGQGAQYIYMLSALYKSQPIYRDMLAHCSELCRKALGLSIADLIYPSEEEKELADKLLMETQYTQPALFIVEYALCHLLRSKGVSPDYMIGHSIGELVSACVAGVFSLDDGLKIIVERGRLINEVSGASMIAVALRRPDLDTLLRDCEFGEYWIAAENSDYQTVLSCKQNVAAKLEKSLQQKGVRFSILKSRHPFHSALLANAAKDFEKFLSNFELNEAQIPFVSNVSGEFITREQASSPAYWAEQIVSPVKFSQGIKQFQQDDIILLEVGPGQVLQSLAKQHSELKGRPCFGIDANLLKVAKSDQFDKLIADLWVQGLNIDRDLLEENLDHKSPLPSQPFDKRRYWLEPITDENAQLPACKQAEPNGNIQGPAQGVSAYESTHAQESLVETAQSIAKTPVSDLIFKPVWETLNVDETTVDRADADSHILLLAYEASAAEKYVACLNEAEVREGNTYTRVVLGEEYKCHDQQNYEIDANEKQSFVALFNTLDKQQKIVDKVIILPSERCVESSEDVYADREFFSTLYCLQALSSCIDSNVQIYLLTHNQFAIGEQDYIDVKQSLHSAFAPVLAHENHRIKLVNIDLDKHDADDIQEMKNIASSLACILNSEEVFASHDIAIRGRDTWKRSFASYKAPSSEELGVDEQKDASISICEGGVYLVIGGLGHVGLTIAEGLADLAECKIVLVGRRDYPLSENEVLISQSFLSESQKEAIAKITGNGSKVFYQQADVADEEELAIAVGSIQKNYGKINGLVHAAGVLGGGVLQGISKDNFGHAAKCKIQGLRNLQKVLIDNSNYNASLDFVVLCSSLVAFSGGLGQLEYCAANKYLDAVATYYSRKCRAESPCPHVMTINWDGWKEGGLLTSDQLLAVRKSLSNTEGKEAFQLCLNSGLSQALVWKKDQSEGGSHVKKRIGVKRSRGKLKQEISLLWQQLLGSSDLEDESNFFEVGGNSLLLVRLTEMLTNEFGIEPEIVDMFRFPTVGKMADYVYELSELQLDTAETSKMHDNIKDVAPEALKSEQPANLHSTQDTQGDIAIIAVSCRLPDANNIEEFWQNISSGVESISESDAKTLASMGLDDAATKAPNWVNASSTIADVEYFDAGFFAYTPNEAKIIDPQQRILLECAYEALESAGYVDVKDIQTGVYVGVASNSYLLQNLVGNESSELKRYSSFDIAIASDKDFAATRISYKLGLQGPSVNVNTACSTSLVAIHQACAALRNSECDIALAGAMHISLPQGSGYLYEEGGILSADGKCRSFDEQANGTVFGDGGGIVVLKPLSIAEKDGDNILAVIKGSAINNDGDNKMGYTVPNGEAQEKVIVEAIQNSGLKPEDISHIETHGTATRLGDSVEMAALARAFKADRDDSNKISLGCVKPCIGHLDAASGFAGLIKLVQSLRYKTIPKLHNFERINPQIESYISNFEFPQETKPWRGGNSPLIGGVSSFGIGGTNAHVVLQEYQASVRERDRREKYLFPISAKSEAALEVYKKAISRDVLTAGAVSDYVTRAAHTLQLSRPNYKYRDLALVGPDKSVTWLSESSSSNLQEKADVLADAPVTFVLGAQSISVQAVDNICQNDAWFKSCFIELISQLARCAKEQGRLDEELWQKIFVFAYTIVQVCYLSSFNLNVENIVYSGSLAPVKYFLTACELNTSLLDLISESEGFALSQKNKEGHQFLAWVKNIEKVLEEQDLSSAGLKIFSHIQTLAAEFEESLFIESAHPESIEDLEQCFSTRALQRPDFLFYIGESSRVCRLMGDGTHFYSEYEGEGGHYSYLLYQLALLWVEGLGIKWNTMSYVPDQDSVVKSVPNKVSLPTHPYLKDYLWVENKQDDSGKSVNRDDGLTYLYRPVWKGFSPLQSQSAKGPQPFLIFLDESGCGRFIGKSLEALSHDVYYVSPSESDDFENNDAGFKINPNDQSHYEQLFSFLVMGIAEKINIVNFWFLDDEDIKSADEAFSADKKGMTSLNHLVALLSASRQNIKIKYSLVFKQSCSPFGNETISIYQAMAGAMLRVVQQEISSLEYSCLDLDGHEVGQEDNLMNLQKDLLTDQKEPQVAYRFGQRWVPEFAELTLQDPLDSYTDDQADVVMEDEPPAHYFIVGGFGQIGRELVKHILADNNVRVSVISRSGVLPSDTSLAALSELPNFHLGKADVCNAQELELAMLESEAINGSVTGVFYLAGKPEFHFVSGVTHETVIEQVRVKFDALQNLEALLAKRNIDFCVLFSSLSSVLGGLGHLPYSSANIALDSYVENHNRNSAQKWLSINWDTWSVSAGGEPGATISTKDGLKFIDQLLECKAHGRVLVSAGDIKPKIDRWVINGKVAGENASSALFADGGPGEGSSHTYKRVLSNEYIPPSSGVESLVHNVWVEIIGQAQIGVNDNFFEIGGDSISAMKVVNILQEEMNAVIHFPSMFEAPTIASYAIYLQENYTQELQAINVLDGVERSDDSSAPQMGVEEFRSLFQGTQQYRKAVEQKNPRAVFVLSPPRCGSTLLRVMLGGSSQLFSPPELNLMAFEDLYQRQNAYQGSGSEQTEAWLTGALQALMESHDLTREESEAYMNEAVNRRMSVQEFYREIQSRIAPKMLVDKTPDYSSNLAVLKRIEILFEDPIYIVLTRHPYGMIYSYEKSKFDLLLDADFRNTLGLPRRQLAEMVWLNAQSNIDEFTAGISAERVVNIQYEQLVVDPQNTLKKLCATIGIEYEEELASPYSNMDKKMVAAVGKTAYSLGDFKFQQYSGVETSRAYDWQNHYKTNFLLPETCGLMEKHKYEKITEIGSVSINRSSVEEELVFEEGEI